MSGLRIAVVGSGPAGMYAIGHLLDQAPEVVESVTVLDRLPTPFGLVRAGVAPDHQKTKKVVVGFGRLLNDPRVRCHFNVEVGPVITHQDLLDHHHAVIYAVGASGSRTLDIPGENLPGSAAATEFVAWYNGHPDFARLSFDLSSPRVVIVGSGNVAVDIARVLTMPIDALRTTDIADHALEALERSAVREVVLLARRGPGSAAFSTPELLALTQLRDIDIIVDTGLDSALDRVPTPERYADRLKLSLLREVAARAPREGNRRIVFRFLSSPVEILGDAHVRGIRVRRNALRRGRLAPTDRIDHLDTSLVLRSIGYRGRPIPGLPFDDGTGIVPNESGRVHPGVYVTGWIKRGPAGVIGTNKHDAAETVAALLDDARSGRLSEPTGDFGRLVAQRAAEAIGLEGWARIDARERELGAPTLRPRVKITSMNGLMDVARDAGLAAVAAAQTTRAR